MSKRGINKVILVGNLGNDPESKQFDKGNVCNFTIATSESWKDKINNTQKEVTEWHRITAYGKLGEICAQYLKKGAKVYIEGSLKTRKWQHSSGIDMYTTEIIASEMQMLEARVSGESREQGQQPQAAPNGFDDELNFGDDPPF